MIRKHGEKTNQDRVMDALKEADGPLTTEQIRRACGMDETEAKGAIYNLRDKGLVWGEPTKLNRSGWTGRTAKIWRIRKSKN